MSEAAPTEPTDLEKLAKILLQLAAGAAAGTIQYAALAETGALFTKMAQEGRTKGTPEEWAAILADDDVARAEALAAIQAG